MPDAQPHGVTPTRAPLRIGTGWASALLILFATVWAALLATQFVAWRFRFHGSLGPPAIFAPPNIQRLLRWAALGLLNGAIVAGAVRRGRRVALSLLVAGSSALAASSGPLYSPVRLFTWYNAYARLAHVATAKQPRSFVPSGNALRSMGIVFVEGFAVLLSASAMAYAALALGRRRGRGMPPSTARGSATWASTRDLRSPDGFLLGRDVVDDSLVRYSGDGHLLTVAPTRSGKGISCVIPTLLTYPGSVLATDVKAELYAVTAQRRCALGHSVHALDPFSVASLLTEAHRASFNPLDVIDATSPDAIDQARLLADMLVMPDPRAAEFWTNEARAVLTGLVLYVAATATGARRTLTEVRRLLMLEPDAFESKMKEMADSAAAFGLIARTAHLIQAKAPEERSGVLSSAKSNTHFLDSPRMETVLGSSSFHFTDLKRTRTTVYFVLPPEQLESYGRWLRLMVACALIAMTQTRGRPKERVLFLLDEFDALGKMTRIESAISQTGGYGVAFWLFLQDLAQLKGTYPEKWQTFVANAEVRQVFGVSDLDTAEYVSRMTGDATVPVESENLSTGLSRGRNAQSQDGAAVTTSTASRRLLLPDEVLRLPASRTLVFIRGRGPTLLRRINYLHDREFAGLATENPMYAAVS
jgi:type IV secretion system protein VirD4